MAAEAASTNKLLDRLAAWVCAGLVLAISYVLVKILFFMLDPQVSAIAPSIYQDASAGGVTVVRATKRSAVDPSAIPLWNLFGKEGASVKAMPKDSNITAPTTRLQLVLMGVSAHRDDSRSTAIISEKNKPGKLYHIGDSVPGNAALAGVFEDRVLLNTRGKLEALYFPQTVSVTKSKKGRSKSSRSKSSRSRSSRSKSSRSSKSRSSKVSKMMRSGASPDKMASTMEEEFGEDPTNALKQLGLVVNNGNGYKVSGDNNPMFAALGLKEGDAIVSFNGMSIGDPIQDVKSIAEALQVSGGNCTVGIQDKSGRQYDQTFPCGGGL